MSTHTLPTDSIQRRHFEQGAAAVGLGPIPEDSIQRRHYLQLLDGRLAAAKPATASVPDSPAIESGGKAEPAPPPKPAQPKSQPSRPAAATPAANPQESKSWFGRLIDRLFGA